MKRNSLPVLALSLAVIAGAVTTTVDVYAQSNTERVAETLDIVKALETALSGLADMVDNLASALESITSTLDMVVDNQDMILDNQDMISDDIATTNNDIQDLNAAIADLESAVSDISGDDGDVSADIDALRDAVSENAANVNIRLNTLADSIDARFTSIEEKLDATSMEISSVQETVTTTPAASTLSGNPTSGTSKRTLTALDYAENYSIRSDTIEFNLAFSCEETVFLSSVDAEPEALMFNLIQKDNTESDTTRNDGTQFHIQTGQTPNSDGSEEIHPFEAPDTNVVTDTDNQKRASGSIMFDGRTLIDTAFKTGTGDDDTTYYDQPADLGLEELSAGEVKTVKTVINRESLFDYSDSTIVPIADAAITEPVIADTIAYDDTLSYVILLNEDPDETNYADLFVDRDAEAKSRNGNYTADVDWKKYDGDALQDVADYKLAELTLEWFSVSDDPKCSFEQRDATDSPERLPQKGTISLSVSASGTIGSFDAMVDCNGETTRIVDADSVKVGIAKAPSRSELDLTAGDKTMHLMIDKEQQVVRDDPVDEDNEIPLTFTSDLRVHGYAASLDQILIEIEYLTTKDNTCTLKQEE